MSFLSTLKFNSRTDISSYRRASPFKAGTGPDREPAIRGFLDLRVGVAETVQDAARAVPVGAVLSHQENGPRFESPWPINTQVLKLSRFYL